MCWSGALRTVDFAGSVEPSLQYGSVPFRGFLLFGFCIWCLSVVHPFVADWGCIRGRIVPKLIFGFPETLHRTVVLYNGWHIGEARNLATIDGV